MFDIYLITLLINFLHYGTLEMHRYERLKLKEGYFFLCRDSNQLICEQKKKKKVSTLKGN